MVSNLCARIDSQRSLDTRHRFILTGIARDSASPVIAVDSRSWTCVIAWEDLLVSLECGAALCI